MEEAEVTDEIRRKAPNVLLEKSHPTSIPADVRVFAEARQFLRVIEETPRKAGGIFPGLKNLTYSLERDPEDSGWKYVQLAMTLDAETDDVLDAMNRFDAWLIEVLPPEELTSFAVVTESIQAD